MPGTAKKIKIPNFLLISIPLNLLVSVNVNPPAEFRPGFDLKSFAAVRPAIHLCSPASGISASLRQATGYSGEGE